MNTQRMRFTKQQRVVSSNRFTLILRKGACAADGVLVLFAIKQADSGAGDQATSRLGITIPKKVGNAVVRNRWKRLIRESYRTQQEAIPQGYDFIIRPKKDAKPTWDGIRKSVPKLASKAIKKLG